MADEQIRSRVSQNDGADFPSIKVLDMDAGSRFEIRSPLPDGAPAAISNNIHSAYWSTLMTICRLVSHDDLQTPKQAPIYLSDERSNRIRYGLVLLYFGLLYFIVL
jgi:hypothetical protein